MAVRDWAAIDYYDVLGVARDASDDEIARRFRTLVKSLHPDLTDPVPEEAQRFQQVVDAYSVLSDPKQRRDYDEVLQMRDLDPPEGVRRRPGVMGTVPKPPTTPMITWTIGKAWAAVLGGLASVLLGLLVAGYTISLHAEDARIASEHTQTTAMVVNRPDGSRALRFVADGQDLTTPIPDHFGGSGSLDPGDMVTVRYRPGAPTDVVLDESHFGRNFMFWFVAVKLLICGPIIAFVGRRRLLALRDEAGRTRSVVLAA